MINIFLLAVQYGVQLKEKDLEGLKSFLISEAEFKQQFKIPKEQTLCNGYRKHRAFKVEELIELCKNHYGNDNLINEIVNEELQTLNYFLEKAKGYNKKSQIKKVENRIEEVQGFEVKTFNYSYDDLFKSGVFPTSRKFLIMASQFKTPDEIMKDTGIRDIIYVPTKEYLELVQLNKGYYKSQLEAAEKTLQNKLKRQKSE
jgi:hypothetical protein